MVDTKAASAPSVEIGYVNGRTNDSLRWNEDERVPDLQWPQSVHTLARMVREDGRASSVIAAIYLPILSTTWSIDPNGAPDEVVDFVARNLGLPIKGQAVTTRPRAKGRFSWLEHLEQALQRCEYGHAYFEQVYRAGGDGRWHLRKLAPRPQKTISKISVELDGGLKSIEQAAPGVSAGVVRATKAAGPNPIPVDRLVAYVRGGDPGDWVGRSILRPAYKHWLLKDELMRLQASTIRRNGMGVPVYEGPVGASDEDIAKGREMASNFRGGEYSGVGMPNGSKFDLKGVSGNLPDAQLAIDYHDRQIALAALAHFLNLDGKGGSYALASVQESTFVQSLGTEARQICDVANQHIVEDLVDLNFGPDVAVPLIVFEKIGSRQDATATALKTLVDAGLIQPSASIEQAILQSLSLPAADPAAATVTPKYTADELATRVGTAKGLIQQGFDPQASLLFVGLDPLEHLGLLPVTVQKPSTAEGVVDEELAERLASEVVS